MKDEGTRSQKGEPGGPKSQQVSYRARTGAQDSAFQLSWFSCCIALPQEAQLFSEAVPCFSPALTPTPGSDLELSKSLLQAPNHCCYITLCGRMISRLSSLPQVGVSVAGSISLDALSGGSPPWALLEELVSILIQHGGQSPPCPVSHIPPPFSTTSQASPEPTLSTSLHTWSQNVGPQFILSSLHLISVSLL